MSDFFDIEDDLTSPSFLIKNEATEPKTLHDGIVEHFAIPGKCKTSLKHKYWNSIFSMPVVQ